MRTRGLLQLFLLSIVMLSVAPGSHAGSDRLIMSMSEQRMEQEDLVYVRFFGPDGAALESNVLSQMVIREQDCGSGRKLKIIDDYKIGYAPKNMLVGIYLFPQSWKYKNLCFSIPDLVKVEQVLNPSTNDGRFFYFKFAP